MGKDLIISSNSHETKLAILDDERLVETYFQRANEYSLVGSIHKGRVTRVLPGMQSAFVDIGLDRDAFLYVSDFFEESDEYEPIASGEAKASRRARSEAAPPASRKREESEGRERRGRRSRRRRPKGRGLPESKYAADVKGKQEKAPPEVKPEEPPEQKQEEPADEFLLLPGESLAKYREREKQVVAEEIPAETGAEEVEEETAVAVAAQDSDEAEAAEQPSEPENGESPAEEDESTVSEDFPAETEEEEQIPGEEDAENSGEEDAAEELSEEEEEAPVEDSGAAETEEAAEAGESEETEEAVVAEENEETVVAESEDSDIKEMILGQLDDAPEPAEQAEEGTGKESEPEKPSKADGEDSQRTSAAVREPGSRYSHRVSRRGRRRGRSSRGDTNSEKKQVQKEASAEPGSGKPRSVSRPERPPLPLISDLLKEGQEILVQVAKEPLGQKGARITSHIALPGRFVVYMPTLDHLGVSRKIASDEERQRLRKILQDNHAGIPGGFIMRTAGQGKTETEIATDMRFLFNLWMDIRQAAEKKPAPVMLHHDLRVIERVLRDQISDEFNTIWVDNEEAYEEVLRFLQRFQPALVNRVRMYTRPAPIFDAFNISQELDKALRPKVWLKSGGYIVINQTEALVAIDINTGKYVGRSNRLEDTIVKTNIEAVREIARQMRLRDLGGIIVVDFIDMDERKNRQKVMQALEEAMRLDRAPYKILQFNDFGLVAITRKRVKQSLERTLCAPCPYCEGAGYVKSVDTIIGEILTEAHKLAPALDGDDVMLRVHPSVAKVLKSAKNDYLQELEEILGRTVVVTADPLLHHEKFDMA